MRSWSRRVRGEQRRLGFVPTMGYLHAGHLSLVDRARARADAVTVSAFVNPIQFGPTEDFAGYPREPARDRTLLAARGVDCLFAPGTDQMYPVPPAVRVEPGALAAALCGPRRPGHFAGVLTVVAKLLHIVEPDVAVFGRKDVQQAVIIRRMVEDLHFAVEIDVAPTVREADGLALSSRNVYLATAERRAAPVLIRGLERAHEAFVGGVTDAARLVDLVRGVVAAESAIRLEYVEAVDPVELAPVTTAAADTILALAAHVGRARLIDNLVLGEGTRGDPRVAGADGA